ELRLGTAYVVEHLGERRPLVPGARVPVDVDSADPPEVLVVAKELCRRERRRHYRVLAADLRADCPLVRGVDLYLVPGGTWNRRPGQLRIEVFGGCVEVA